MKTNTGKLRDLEGRQQQLLRLVELSMTLNSTLDLDELLQTITATATELLDCEAASILLYDEKNPRLYFAAATGSDPAKLAEIPVPMEGSIAGTIFRTNQPIAMTASFGVDVYLPADRDDPSQFLHRADSWLFQAKANGRNRVCHAPLENHAGVSHDERELLLGN